MLNVTLTPIEERGRFSLVVTRDGHIVDRRDNVSVTCKKGIMQVADHTAGTVYSAHPTRHPTSNKTGLVKQRLWSKDAKEVRVFGFIHDVSRESVRLPFDSLAKYFQDNGLAPLLSGEAVTVEIQEVN